MIDSIYSNILKHSPIATFVYEPNSRRFIYVNPQFESICGYTAEQITVELLRKQLSKEDVSYARELFEQVLNKGESDTEFKFGFEGSYKWLKISARRVIDEERKLIIGYVSDITAETYNYETQRKYANKKNAILNILSHDLRGPLGVANTITEIVSKKISDKQLGGLIKTLSKVIRQSVDMIADLTGREFLETADVQLVKTRVDISRKLKEYMEEFEQAEENADRHFGFVSSHDSIFLSVDEPKFIQIFNNLMTNALKFTNSGGSIALELEDKEDSVVITFKDDGIGIPAHLHSSIFKEFSKAGRTGLQGEPTVGLGLSIVKTIIEWHEGKIWFKSEEGTGTTFYILFPKT